MLEMIDYGRKVCCVNFSSFTYMICILFFFLFSGLKIDITAIAKIKSKYSVYFNSSCICFLKSICLRRFYVSTEVLLDLEAAIDSYDVSSDKGLTKPGM